MAKKDTSKLAVALIDLRHLSAPAGAILQGSALAIDALVAAGAADDAKGAITYAKAQHAPVVDLLEEAPAEASSEAAAAGGEKSAA
jgi:hypothetical protein